MQLMSKGKDEAFQVIYHRYWDRMYWFFFRMLYNDRELAADFAQNLFMKLIENPNSFDPSRRFSTRVYAVAHNMVKNEYRRRSRLPSVEATVAEETHVHSQSILERLEDKDRIKQISVALKYLNPKQRICFVLRYYEQLSILEISEITNVPEGTVKSRLFHAVNLLAQKIRSCMTTIL